MARGKMFECVVLYHPKAKKDDKGDTVEQKSELVLGPKPILAATEQQAGMMVARLIPEEYVDKLEDVEVAIRPF